MIHLSKAENILQQCAPLIAQINQHPLYSRIQSLDHLQIFMEHHVFAVWDFMCLLKELHRRIVCTQAPWFPPKNAYCAHLISRILMEEESDRTEDQQEYLSHFELYLTTMKKIGANVQPIQAFLNLLGSGTNVIVALRKLALPPNVQTFLRYYLQRHIELDHDDHFPQALRMLDQLAGDDAHHWKEIAAAAQQALQARLDFLAGIHVAILVKKTNESGNGIRFTKTENSI